MDVAVIVSGVGFLIFLSYLFNYIFQKYRIPDVLFLVVIGLFLGPITGFIDVTQVGVLGEFFAILTVVLILFESGLSIKASDLFKSAPRGLALMALTMIISTIPIALLGHYILEIALAESIIIGVLLGSVSSGLAVPLAQRLPVSDETESLLSVEGNMSVVFTVAIVFAILDFNSTGIFDLQAFSSSISVNTIIAIFVGATAAILWSQTIAKMRAVQNSIFMTPALVLMVFGVSELLGASGVFAAFAFGITLGNLQFINIKKLPKSLGFHKFTLTKWEKRMFSGLVFLLKTYFFVFIGLSIEIGNLFVLFIGFVAAVLLFLARAAAVNIISKKGMSEFDRQILMRLFPKGLIGAALVTLLTEQVARDFTYSVMLFCIIFTSILLFSLSKESVEEAEAHEAEEEEKKKANA